MSNLGATPEAESIIELAEVCKELIRVLQCQANLGKLSNEFNERLDKAYSKLIRSKDRMTFEYGSK